MMSLHSASSLRWNIESLLPMSTSSLMNLQIWQGPSQGGGGCLDAWSSLRSEEPGLCSSLTGSVAIVAKNAVIFEELENLPVMSRLWAWTHGIESV